MSNELPCTACISFSYVAINLKWLDNSLTYYTFLIHSLLRIRTFINHVHSVMTGQDGTTPLMLAARLGHDSIVTQLLKKQADPDTQNRVRAIDYTPCVVERWANDACEEGWTESETSQRDLLEYTDFLLFTDGSGMGVTSFITHLLFVGCSSLQILKTNLHDLSESFAIFELHVGSCDISSITAGWLYSTYVSYTVWSCQHCEANPG